MYHFLLVGYKNDVLGESSCKNISINIE